ncbi:MAG TPA: VanW family protein, partial [Acidimicrobiia bacterium]
MLRRLTTLLGLVVAVLVILGSSPSSAELPPGGTFIDDDGNVHEGSIEAVFAAQITSGCDERGIRFCPDLVVTRGQMAAFLARALNLAPASEDYFTDDDGSTFEGAIDKIAEAGITVGCNPPDHDEYCPDKRVTRAEMATLLVRAFPELLLETAPDVFTDDGDSVHHTNINRIAAERITLGCNPPDNDNFCPDEGVSRAQMATFLTRALKLQAVKPPAQFPIERVSRFTTFYDCCQPRVTNIRRMAAEVDGYVVMPGETFSIDQVVGPRTSSGGYVPAPYLQNGQGRCCAIGGGVSQFGTTIHNAVFWGGYQIDDHRPHTGWISRYPLGIEATLVYSSIDFKFTNDTVTPVYIETSSTGT